MVINNNIHAPWQHKIHNNKAFFQLSTLNPQEQ